MSQRLKQTQTANKPMKRYIVLPFRKCRLKPQEGTPYPH